jgi:hypothetical protein
MSSDTSLLLELLEKHKHIPSEEIEFFIRDRKILPSKKPTTNAVIYWTYLHWKATVGGYPLIRTVFFKQFKKHFNPASRDRVRRYYATSEYFNLHPRDKASAQDEPRKERAWQKRRRARAMRQRTQG